MIASVGSDTDEREGGTNSECGEVVSLHDLCLKYSSCFFGSFPLGHFIIDNICHRMAAAPCLMWSRSGREGWSRQNYFCFEKKLNLLSTVQSWAGEKSFFSKAPTLGGVHPISSHKWWPNIFQQKLVHQYIVSPTKLSRYHETEEEVEGGSLRNIEAGRPGEPMSNHYFSV